MTANKASLVPTVPFDLSAFVVSEELSEILSIPFPGKTAVRKSCFLDSPQGVTVRYQFTGWVSLLKEGAQGSLTNIPDWTSLMQRELRVSDSQKCQEAMSQWHIALITPLPVCC